MNAKELFDFLKDCLKFFDIKYNEMDKLKIHASISEIKVTYNTETITKQFKDK